MKRCICLLLAVLLLIGAMPAAYAAELTGPAEQAGGNDCLPTEAGNPVEPIAEFTNPPDDPTEGMGSTDLMVEAEEPTPVVETPVPSEETTTPTMEPSVPSEESTVPTTEPTVPAEEVTIPTEEQDFIVEDENLLDVDGFGLMSIDSTQRGILLFNYTDNGDYTTRLNYQVSCTYQLNGNGATKTAYIKNLGWHFARYGGVPYPDNPLYCLEPYRDFGASTSGNTVDRGVTLDGSGTTAGSNVWYALPAARREAIGRILLYSSQMWNHSVSVSNTAYSSNPNVPLRIATQFLIYEIVCGLRDPSSFVRNAANECGTPGDVFYNAGAASVSGFTSAYSSLEASIRSANLIPSFTSAYSSGAPMISLTGQDTSVLDTNGVLSGFSFANGNGASFEKSGNTLYITQTGNISESSVFQATRNVPSAAGSTYDLWYMAGSGYQTTISLARASSGSLSGYFRLKGVPQTGNVKIIKATNTGLDLAGWSIGLYTDANCTNPISVSPFVTGTDGTVVAAGLQPGTYYAKELPTENTYWEVDPEVKTVTVVSGQTGELRFFNTCYGSITIHKTTNTGNHLGGWTFVVRNADGETVGTYTTDENGYVRTGNLPLGRYTVTEQAVQDDYWLAQIGFHDVTVTGDRTTVDEWHNKEQGLAWFLKKANTGADVDGWHITIYSDEACTQVAKEVVTNQEGKVGYYLDPGIYWAKETGHQDGLFEDAYWQIDQSIQQFEVKPHESTEVVFSNAHCGKVKIVKTMEDSSSPEGWQFKITGPDGKEIEGSPFVTGTDGTVLTENLLPGDYTVEELLPEDSVYSCQTENPVTVTVKAGETAEVPFTNALRPARIWIEKVDSTGKHLAGAVFRLECSADDGKTWANIFYSDQKQPVKGGCSNAGLVDGCLTSNDQGELAWNNLYPGLRYRVTETQAPEGYTRLKGTAFNDTITVKDLDVTIRVVNNRGFLLPKTGSTSLRIVSLVGAVALVASLVAILSNTHPNKRRKKR